MESLNLSKQALLIPEDKIRQYTIKVFGVGSVGSHFVKVMAKAGFINFEVYDMDIVEEDNLSAQAYDFKHVGMLKVDALKEIIKESAGVEIKTFNGLITPETEIAIEGNTIYCCFFDSIEARRMIFDKVKDYPVPYVDARIGMFNMRHYLIDCKNKEDKEVYETTLDNNVASELACGEKACAVVNVQIAGKLAMNIINFIKGDQYIKVYVGNASNPKTDLIVQSNMEVSD